jgi:excisionase family DNA binding protein
MAPLATIPTRHAQRTRPSTPQPATRLHTDFVVPVRGAITEPPDRSLHGTERAFTPLIDAKAASQLLGVPHTWLLAQAREQRIPHHRLGHYVRFNPEDLQQWLKETRSMPHDGRFQAPRRRI